MFFWWLAADARAETTPVQGQAVPSWQDGTEVWKLAVTVARFFESFQSWEKNSLVTMAADFLKGKCLT